MEKLKISNTRKALIAAGALSLAALTGCAGGQQNPPTPEEIKANLTIFELDTVVAANGEPVRCVQYGADSENTQYSKSWFGFDCDFEGTAYFPGELKVVPTLPEDTTTTTAG